MRKKRLVSPWGSNWNTSIYTICPNLGLLYIQEDEEEEGGGSRRSRSSRRNNTKRTWTIERILCFVFVERERRAR
jgi:hypothetical protein